MVFLLTDDDREALEAFRAGRGCRSLADALRTLIRDTRKPTPSKPVSAKPKAPAAPPKVYGHPKPTKGKK
jgi:hypothetical protein